MIEEMSNRFTFGIRKGMKNTYLKISCFYIIKANGHNFNTPKNQIINQTTKTTKSNDQGKGLTVTKKIYKIVK